MSHLIYSKIDAFTDGLSSGNPAGVVYLPKNKTLTAETMQAIARREKGIVSEVAFCTPLAEDLYSLKYYSSECEVEFCGHATIACMYHLVKTNPSLTHINRLRIVNNKGELPVWNDLLASDSVFITAPEPQYFEISLSTHAIAANLEIPLEIIDKNWDVALIDAGLRTLLVPIQSLKGILNIQPNQAKLADFCVDNGIDIILVFSAETSNPANMFRTRVFAPKFGYLEDPATGSGNSAFGYYLMQQQKWTGSNATLEQGPDPVHPNHVKLKSVEINGKLRVAFGGNAALRYEKPLEVEL